MDEGEVVEGRITSVSRSLDIIVRLSGSAPLALSGHLLILEKVFVDFVEEPIDEFVGVVVLVVIKEGIAGLEGQDEALMVKGTFGFPIAC